MLGVSADPDADVPSFVVRLPYRESAARAARQHVEDLLAQVVHRPGRDADAALVIHELVVNALDHGEPDERHELEVSGRVDDGHLEVSVKDHGDQGLVIAWPFSPDRPRGRGLAMVAALSSSWTVDRSSGTRVTATLAL